MNRKIILGIAALALVALAVWYFLPEKKAAPISQVAQELMGDPQLTQLTQELEKNPNNDTLLYLRAGAYYRLEAYDEAMADL